MTRELALPFSNKKAQIFTASLELFAERGYEYVSMRDIADAVENSTY